MSESCPAAAAAASAAAAVVVTSADGGTAGVGVEAAASMPAMGPAWPLAAAADALPPLPGATFASSCSSSISWKRPDRADFLMRLRAFSESILSSS